MRRSILVLVHFLSACAVEEDEPEPPTLTELQAQVFGPSCGYAGCHGGATPAEGLDLSSAMSSFTTTVGVTATQTFNGSPASRVAVGNADASYLFLKITGTTGVQGAPMPLGLAPLPQDRIDAIAEWINAGAMNN